MDHRVVLSLGSNIDPRPNLVRAVEELSKIGRFHAISSVWETAPIGLTRQPNFLNVVLLIETPRPVDALISEDIPRIEESLGRVRDGDRYGPRTIDIDVILFNDFVGEVEGRRIPSPEIIERPFVGILLAEIAGDQIHPEAGISFAEIAERFAIETDSMTRLPDLDLTHFSRGH